MPQTHEQKKRVIKTRSDQREALLRSLLETGQQGMPNLANLIMAVTNYISIDDLAREIANQIKNGSDEDKPRWLKAFLDLLNRYHTSADALKDADIEGMSDDELRSTLQKRFGMEFGKRRNGKHRKDEARLEDPAGVDGSGVLA